MVALFTNSSPNTYKVFKNWHNSDNFRKTQKNDKPHSRIRIGFITDPDLDPAFYLNADADPDLESRTRRVNQCGFGSMWIRIRILIGHCRHTEEEFVMLNLL